MNIIGRRKIWYLISGAILIPGAVALSLWGLRFGIDFKGGSLLEVKFEKKEVTKTEIETSLKELNLKNLIISQTGEGSFLIRTEPLNEETHQKITQNLGQKIGESKEIRYEVVGPTIGKDLRKKAIIGLIIAVIGIIFYLAWAFRKVQKPASPWRFGICAVLALIHDLLVLIGVFAFLGRFSGFEIDSLFITALLTTMGYSVHDTIVVFDRIRENLKLSIQRGEESFEKIVNQSTVQTLARSLNTSLTVLLVLVALYLLGGSSLKHFILALLVGIGIGTYSSIFVASPLLVTWQNFIQRRGQNT